ncbi:MAG TPA: MBL fold metallo-hydrolase [Amycolatopsis sp.]|nr:MBL fold metallo-hydrolase [Amycolatopsis sp.]
MSIDPRGAVTVTGTAQYEAWQCHLPPPVEKLPYGVWSVPVPMTGHPLRYTLCYVVDGRNGPVLIDPGWPDDAAWDGLVAGLATAGFAPSDVDGVLVSHAHSDHHGLAGRVRERSGCWIGMHPRDAATLRGYADPATVRTSDDTLFDIAGVPGSERPGLHRDERMLRSLARTLPDRDIDENVTGLVPGRALRALWTPGHTPGHLTFVEPDAGIALTGDHLLPRITTNVAMYDLAAEDVLGTYLRSVSRLGSLGDEVEVLPAHEYRFRGARARISALEGHHTARLAEIATAVRELGSGTVWEIAAVVAWSRGWAATTGGRRRLALAETLAHLRHLQVTGSIRRAGDRPAQWYVT